MNYYNYFTEIEEHFVRKRGKHLLISPMDWALIATWKEAGIPLYVALRGIDIAMDKFFAKQHRGHAKVNSLCYCHDAVLSEFATHLEAHVGETTPETRSVAPDPESRPQNAEGPGIESLTGLISARMSEIKTLYTKQYSESTVEGLNRVLARLEEVRQSLKPETDAEALERDLRLIDEVLVSELRLLISQEEAVDWEKEAKKELKVYKKQLPKETFDKIHSNFMRDRIHRKFGIGDLSLFHL